MAKDRAEPPHEKRVPWEGLKQINPSAAGIDAGAASHCVAVPEDRDEHPVREFASFR